MSDSIPSLQPSVRTVLACLWQVNTLTDSESVTLTGLAGMNWSARIKMLTEAVGAAAKKMEEFGGSSSALRIFVAPEFYFSTVEGHFFDELAKEQIRAALIALSKDFKDILIIPGSVAWYKTALRPGMRAERKAEKHSGQVPQRDFNKYAKLYERPLAPPATKYAGFAQDELIPYWKDTLKHFGTRLAEADGTLKIAHNTIFVLFQGGIWHKYNKRHEAVADGSSLDVPEHADRANIVFPPTDSNPNLPAIDGIRIGLETCVDHEHASLLTHSGTGNHLHIVASGTVSLMREHAAVTGGGFVLQADPNFTGAHRPSDLFPGNIDPYASDEDNPKQAPRQQGVEVKAPLGMLYLYALQLTVP